MAAQMAAKRPTMKVLYISGYTDDSVFRHGVLEGGMAFLQKPFNMIRSRRKSAKLSTASLLPCLSTRRAERARSRQTRLSVP